MKSIKILFEMAFSASPLLLFIYCFLYCVQGLVPLLLVFLESKFFDILLCTDIQSIIAVFCALLLCISIQWMIGSVQQSILNMMRIRMREYMYSIILEKKITLPYYLFESKDTCDLIKQVSDDCEIKISNAIKNRLLLLTDMISISSLLFALINQISLYIVFAFVFFIPLFYFAFKAGKNEYILSKSYLNKIRSNQYKSEILQGSDAVQEKFLFDYGDALNTKVLEEAETIRKETVFLRFKWFLRLKSTSITMSLFLLIIVLFMLNSLINGKITMGLFIAFFSIIYSLQEKLSWEITEVIDNIAKDKEYLNDLKKFLLLQDNSELGTKMIVEINKVEFANVSFKYPGTDRYIIKNFNFTFEKGKTYSLIGINGAGKSTLINLLVKNYTSYDGEIFINNIELRKINDESYKKLISVVFQEFNDFKICLKDNLDYDENDLNEKKIINDFEIDKIIDSLPNGISTNIGDIYEEKNNLSKGQLQLIAIVRGVLKKSQLFILDEPTASLDPLKEYEIMKKIIKYKKNNLLLLISHRLGIAKDSDVIILLGNGQIIQSGNHDYMYKNCNEYKEMFDTQKGWYMK